MDKKPNLKCNFSPVVGTTTGQMRGLINADNGQMQYLGIPYAEPPVSELRFRKTMPKQPWDGVMDATQFGHAGPQIFDPSEGDYEEFSGEKNRPAGKEWVGSEDNLTLNVLTPSVEGERPVIVWIHGGANWLESSRLYTYHGDDLVERGDVVFVSLNYRLGIFGWLDVSVLGGEEYKGSHSNGLHDQLTALRWIKDNIASFGGDADNITIMGESAGSIDLSWLLANGHLNGIAKRVVLMSGIAGLIGLSGDLTHGFSEDYSQQDAKGLLEKLDVKSMDDLLSSSTEELMTRMVEIVESTSTLFYMDSIFWPRQSDFTPLDPFRAAEAKVNADIDVIIGYTAYEMGLWLTWDESLDKNSASWAADKIHDFSSEDIRQKAVELYKQALPQETDGRLAMHLIGDSIFVIPSFYFADQLSSKGVKTLMFQFDWAADARRGAMHAADQTFLFNSHDTQAGHHICGVAADDSEKSARLSLTRMMQDAILSFAKTGDVNAAKNQNMPLWPEYSKDKRQVMGFNLQPEIHADPIGQRREWWYDNIYRPALK